MSASISPKCRAHRSYVKAIREIQIPYSEREAAIELMITLRMEGNHERSLIIFSSRGSLICFTSEKKSLLWRQHERRHSHQNVGAFCSYVEALIEIHIPSYSERGSGARANDHSQDGRICQTSVAVAPGVSPHASDNNHNQVALDLNNSASRNHQVEVFHEFYLCGSVSGFKIHQQVECIGKINEDITTNMIIIIMEIGIMMIRLVVEETLSTDIEMMVSGNSNICVTFIVFCLT
ncbi:uncharacterized protein LOC120140811 [Hibiscus syriacus]|uniref:uncharacterized protein LOC120140811 n=1 Tax=Hibiscus syriacus TaxID=106335 RepID=UPI001921A713|nr:uncharacterized protein LOC120140811 [Hibiscus syriacus]